jgi:hypothetical protein
MSDFFIVILIVNKNFLANFWETLDKQERNEVFPKFSADFLERFNMTEGKPASGQLLTTMGIARLVYKTEIAARTAISILPKNFPEEIESAAAEWELPQGRAF